MIYEIVKNKELESENWIFMKIRPMDDLNFAEKIVWYCWRNYYRTEMYYKAKDLKLLYHFAKDVLRNKQFDGKDDFYRFFKEEC